jgi:hypothetical protein
MCSREAPLANNSDVSIEPFRGSNPEPAEGWSWFLTPYELAYVEQFNVRPVREGSWVGSEDAELRLEQEAEGIRSPLPAPKRPRWTRRPARLRWLWILATAVVFAVSAGLLGFGVVNTLHAQQIKADTIKIGSTFQK